LKERYRLRNDFVPVLITELQGINKQTSKQFIILAFLASLSSTTYPFQGTFWIIMGGAQEHHHVLIIHRQVQVLLIWVKKKLLKT